MATRTHEAQYRNHTCCTGSAQALGPGISMKLASNFRQFVVLSPRRRALLLQTLCLLSLVRASLSLLPFRVVRAAVMRAGQPSRAGVQAEPEFVEDVVWAIGTASCRVPGASCLTQALATELLLRRRGFPAVLRIGVAEKQGGKVEAHAWIEAEGRVLVGGSESPAHFTVLSRPKT
jgi:hypothetical protein